MSLAAKGVRFVRGSLCSSHERRLLQPDQTITSRRTVLWVTLAIKAGMFLTEILILPLTD
jgi:hypothetical protein